MDKQTDNNKNLPGLMMTEFKQDMLDPYMQKRTESLVLFKKESVGVNNALKTTIPTSEREDVWASLEPFDVAKKAGETIVQRVLSENDRLTGSSDDRNLIEYLSDWSGLGGFLETTSMGETKDFEIQSTHRKPRIVGMLKSAEEKWKATGNNLETIDDWERFFGKIYGFFDTKSTDERDRHEAMWLKTYIVFYTTAWNFSPIDFIDGPEDDDLSSRKFTGMVSSLLNLPEDKRKKLIDRARVLELSTNMELPNETSIAGALMQSLQNLESSKDFSK